MREGEGGAGMQLHEQLRVALATSDMRQRDLARRLGLDEGYLSRILAGKQPPPPATLVRLVLALHGLDTTTETNQRPRVAA